MTRPTPERLKEIREQITDKRFGWPQELLAEIDALNVDWAKEIESALREVRKEALKESANICKKYAQDHRSSMNRQLSGYACEGKILALINPETKESDCPTCAQLK